ncbi:nitroreductase [Tatumella terrea]|uniref:Nitroreductase n=1 Tax=Tatumella terrea TaxID=419007 RepID=A0ABW1VZZ9_9GAMM
MRNPRNPLSELLTHRHSCRAFLDDPVPLSDIRHLLQAARRAPSGANLQPGMFHVYTGEPLAEMKAQLTLIAQQPPEEELYSYFPQPMPEFLKQRQRDAGYALYQALDIQKRDTEGRRRQFAANYRFFDAPVGIVVTLHRQMGAGCFMDLGMALMSFFLAAQELGYGTCGIGALANYGRAIHRLMALPDEETVVCGIALGRPDITAAVNNFRTSRAPAEEYCTLHGFTGGEGE